MTKIEQLQAHHEINSIPSLASPKVFASAAWEWKDLGCEDFLTFLLERAIWDHHHPREEWLGLWQKTIHLGLDPFLNRLVSYAANRSKKKHTLQEVVCVLPGLPRLLASQDFIRCCRSCPHPYLEPFLPHQASPLPMEQCLADLPERQRSLAAAWACSAVLIFGVCVACPVVVSASAAIVWCVPGAVAWSMHIRDRRCAGLWQKLQHQLAQ